LPATTKNHISPAHDKKYTGESLFCWPIAASTRNLPILLTVAVVRLPARRLYSTLIRDTSWLWRTDHIPTMLLPTASGWDFRTDDSISIVRRENGNRLPIMTNKTGTFPCGEVRVLANHHHRCHSGTKSEP
jgi:hypothetical protein